MIRAQEQSVLEFEEVVVPLTEVPVVPVVLHDSRFSSSGLEFMGFRGHLKTQKPWRKMGLGLPETRRTDPQSPSRQPSPEREGGSPKTTL